MTRTDNIELAEKSLSFQLGDKVGDRLAVVLAHSVESHTMHFLMDGFDSNRLDVC